MSISSPKIIVQRYASITQFGFNDFVRGTLSLIQYGIDNKIKIALNIEGSEISSYVIAKNYPISNYPVNQLYDEPNYKRLYDTLETFRTNNTPLLIVSTDWTVPPQNITDLAIIEFNKLLQFTPAIYTLANLRASAELLNVNLPHTNPIIQQPIPTNYNYSCPAPTAKESDFNVIYVDMNTDIFLDFLDTATLVSKISSLVSFSKNCIVLSNNKLLKDEIDKLLVINYVPGSVYNKYDWANITNEVFWSLEDTIVNFLLLANSKKVIVFTEKSMPVNHDYDIAILFLRVSTQMFSYFYKKVDISPMPGY